MEIPACLLPIQKTVHLTLTLKPAEAVSISSWHSRHANLFFVTPVTVARLGLGLCELKKENWPMATKRLESAISDAWRSQHT